MSGELEVKCTDCGKVRGLVSAWGFPMTMSDPTDDELRAIYYTGGADHEGYFGPGLRSVFSAGRASVTPSREAIAQWYSDNSSHDSALTPRFIQMTTYGFADAVLALLGVVPSTGNKEKI